MNHKRKRPKNRRAGCLACKYWKQNGRSRRSGKNRENRTRQEMRADDREKEA